jgi:hypothetical protein
MARELAYSVFVVEWNAARLDAGDTMYRSVCASTVFD